MAQATRDKKISLKSGHFQGMSITFGTSIAFEGHHPVLSLAQDGSTATQPQTLDGPKSISVTINGNNGDVTISESRGSTSAKVRKGVLLSYGSYTVLANERLDNNVWHILIESKKAIVVQSGDAEQGELYTQAKKQGKTSHADSIAERMRQDMILGKWEYWMHSREVNFVKVLVPDCDRSKFVDMSQFGEVFTNLKVLRPDVSPNDYIAATIAALDIEKALADAEKEKMSRDNIRCYFFQKAERPEQLHVRMSEAPTTEPRSAWALGSHETIIFRRAGRLLDITPTVIENESVFANAPPPVPGSNALISGWTGRTYLRGKTLYAKIENDLSVYTSSNYLRHAFGSVCEGVEIEVVTEDVVRDRIDIALDTLETVMMFESGTLGEDLEVPSFISKYRMNLSSLFLDQTPYEVTPLPRVLLNPGESWELIHEGGNPTQRRAIMTALTARQGIACIQGPPATGKTTTVAHLLTNATELLDPKGGMIVCGAETNEAVCVMAARFHKVYAEIHGIEAANAKIVVVDTQAKQQYARLSGDLPRYEVRPLLLRAHMKKLARSKPAVYKAWLQGDREMNLKGHITDNGLFRKHFKQERHLIEAIKARRIIAFSTLATMHCKDLFFGGRKGEPCFDCSLFVCDEASQVTSASYALSITTLNPAAVVLCGDHKQLSPYVKSTDQLPILRHSIFERHIRKGAPSVMLDIEYRTRAEIYCGTNVHYNNAVQVAPEVHARDSQFYTDFMEAIKHISFVQTVVIDGQRMREHTYFTHNVHFINIEDGICEKIGESQSSINQKEAAFIRGLVGCLLKWGLDPRYIRAITGYNGQYDALRHDLSGWGIRSHKVDGFQGGEEHMIIVSMVRTAESGVGFFGRSDRENVTLSRAKDVQIIVGDRTLVEQCKKKSPSWSRAINALENFSPDQKEKFQINVKGEIEEWCVDGEPVDFRKEIESKFIESFDEPIPRGAVLPDEDEDEFDIDNVVEEEEVKEEPKEGPVDVQAKEDTERRLAYFEAQRNWFLTEGNIPAFAKNDVERLRDNLGRAVKKEKAGKVDNTQVINDVLFVAIEEWGLDSALVHKVDEYVRQKAMLEGLDELDSW